MRNSNKEILFCFLLIGVIIAFCFYQCKTESSKPIVSGYQSSVTNRNSDEYKSITTNELTEEDSLCLDVSLDTGSEPYNDFYGNGYDCPYDQCSGIRVTAPQESDIVVIIKRNDEKGKVVQHGYIKKGETCQFDVSDGKYQTFFYYGRGWNSNKPMKNGIKGGFVTDEIFSKDEPQEIVSGVLEYVLQLRRDGNFQTEGSDLSEMF